MRRHRTIAAIVLSALCIVPSACDTPTDQPARVTAQDAYGAAIGTVAEPGTADEPTPVIVIAAGEAAVDLGVQIEVIGALADRYDVRFVDTRAAAAQEALGWPAPDAVWIVAVHVIEPGATWDDDTDEALLRVERRRGDEAVTAELLTIRRRGPDTVVVGAEPVEPEVLGEI